MRFVYKVCVSVSIRCHCIVNLIVTLLFVAADNSVMSTSDINNIKPIKQAESLYYNYFWGRKVNLSGKAQPIRTRSDQIRYTLTCHGVTTFREFWAQSARFGQNGSWYESCGARFFVVIQTTFRQLRNVRFSPNLVTKRSSVSRRGIRKDIFKTHYFRGHLPPKSEIENRSNSLTGTSLRAGYMSGDALQRDTVYSTLQSKGHEVSKVGQLFSIRRTFAELRGVKVVQCSDFCLFFLYKTPKTYLPVTSIQPRGYIAE